MQPLASVPSRTEQVYVSIRDSICDCSLEPGRHLVQEDLAAALGVSRQPVQQAMLLLKNDGLVVERGGRGLYVAPVDPAAMVHHYQIRMVLDVLAAELVAIRAAGDPAFRALLLRRGERILDEGNAALASGNATAAVRHDVAFHSFLYDLSGNPMIGPAAEAHWLFLRRVMLGVVRLAERGPLVWAQHRAILDALASSDVAASKALAAEHVTGAQAAMATALASGEADRLFGTVKP